MLQKTRGIVLNYIKYRETSIIARIYTEDFGLQSYLINGVRSQRSKKGLALLQPLSALDMVVYYKESKTDGLQRLSEYKPLVSFTSIPFDVKKSAIALFITELLTKVLKEEDDRGHVFEFLYQFTLQLDQKKENYENMHLFLMVQLTHFIGFGISHQDGLVHQSLLSETKDQDKKIHDAILVLNDQDMAADFEISNTLRRNVMNFLIAYYKEHLEGFKDLKSLEVLTQIFR